jgi:immediate early response 3-interacting protein 1
MTIYVGHVQIRRFTKLSTTFLQAGLLMTNSVMILNRRRFLARYGLDDVANMGVDPSSRPLQVQIIGFLQAVQYLKVPVVAANVLVIVFELLLGGT